MEKCLTGYYFGSDVINRFKYSITHWCVISHIRANYILQTMLSELYTSFFYWFFLEYVFKRHITCNVLKIHNNCLQRIHYRYISSNVFNIIYLFYVLPSISMRQFFGISSQFWSIRIRNDAGNNLKSMCPCFATNDVPSLETVNTPLCVCKFDPAKNITPHVVQGFGDCHRNLFSPKVRRVNSVPFLSH